MNETVLIGRSEKFLDGIKRKKLISNAIFTLKGFSETYQYLKDNLEELQELKDVMESKGYKAPYRSLSKYGSVSSGEIMVEEIHDINRHNQYFRMKAAAKKNVLDRVKSAISSHKIALGNLEEFGLIKCRSCFKTYGIQEIQNLDILNCMCGSSDWELEINQTGVFRIEIINHLPLSGDYMAKMSELTPWGRDSFRKIMKILKQERKGVVKTVSLVIRVLESGRWIRKRVTLDGDDKLNYEKELRKKYGPNVRIEFLQFRRKKPTIINDRQTRTALALGYVKATEDFIKQTKDEILKTMLHNLENLKKYDLLVEKSEEYKPTGLEELDSVEEIKKAELTRLLRENDLLDSEGNLNYNLKNDLETRIKIEKDIFTQIPITLILWDLTKYYLTTSYDRRNQYSGPFPHLRPNLDRNQVKAIHDFDPETVKILKTYKKENIDCIPQIQNVLLKKFEIEQKMKGLNMKTNHTAFAAAIINIESKLDIKICADLFSVEIKDLETEKNSIQTLGKPATKKAQKFLEMIKK